MTDSSTSPVAGQKARRQHTKDYKQKAIALAGDPEVGFCRAAKDLRLNESLLRKWADLSDNEGAEAFRGNGKRTEEGEQIAALQREVRILREERDILKKATEFFVKERK